MRFHSLNTQFSGALAALLSAWLLIPSVLRGDDWLTWPSTYTHSPVTGERVDQFAVAEQPLAPYRGDFSRSGYRHFRSTLQAGQSTDNMHVVEQWGRPVIPYEQWRFPFRPYSVPYDAWGPQAPYGITNGYFGLGGGSAFGGAAYGGAAAYGGGYYGGAGYDPRMSVPPNGSSSPTGDPNRPYPQAPWYGRPGMGGSQLPSRGFPLTPSYGNEPWYDGNYPDAPPLGRPDVR